MLQRYYLLDMLTKNLKSEKKKYIKHKVPL